MKKLLSILLLLQLLQSSNAQVVIVGKLRPGNLFDRHFVVTKRGDRLYGRVLGLDAGIVDLQLPSKSTTQFWLSDVDSIIYSSKERKNISEGPLDVPTRIMFSPTAFALPAGKWEFHNEMVITNSINYGIADWYTAGVGLFVVPDGLFSWANMKWSVQWGEYLRMAAGGMMGIGTEFQKSGDRPRSTPRLMIGYLATTFGSANNFVNLVVSRGVADEDGDADPSPWMYSLGTSHRISKRGKVFLEMGNILPIESDNSLVNLGFGILGKRSTTNLGVVLGEQVFWMPTLAYTRRW